MSILLIVLMLSVMIGVFLFHQQEFATDQSAVLSTDIASLKQHIESDITRLGAVAAYEEFKKSYRNASFDVQHSAAHLFGELLYTSAGSEGVAVCDDEMNFGCFHGFFRGAVTREGLQVVAQLDDACTMSESAHTLACQHGIGHGIMEYVGRDRLAEALAACRDTRQTNPLAGCTSGVFMEYNVPLSENSGGRKTVEPRILEDQTHPYDPCPRVTTSFRPSCYHELPQWWLGVLGGDFARMGVLCAAVHEPTERDACIKGIGNIVGMSTGYHEDMSRERCMLLPDESMRSECIVVASWAFVWNMNDPARGAALCAHALPDDQVQCPSYP